MMITDIAEMYSEANVRSVKCLYSVTLLRKMFSCLHGYGHEKLDCAMLILAQ